VAEGHCEVPRDVTSEILERAGFQASGSESVVERNGREKGREPKPKKVGFWACYTK
jgi:hypothetical protein